MGNNQKEAYWRLTVDGIPLLSNSHMRRAGVARCGCGVRPGHGESRDTPRQHQFWACPVAQAVVGQVEPRLGTTITRANVWLVQAPGHTEQCVWDVIVQSNACGMSYCWQQWPLWKWEGALWQRRRGGGATRESLDWRQEWSWRREAQDGQR